MYSSGVPQQPRCNANRSIDASAALLPRVERVGFGLLPLADDLLLEPPAVRARLRLGLRLGLGLGLELGLGLGFGLGLDLLLKPPAVRWAAVVLRGALGTVAEDKMQQLQLDRCRQRLPGQ